VIVATATACAGHSTKPKAPPPATAVSFFPAEEAWVRDLDGPATAPAAADNARAYVPFADHIRAFDRESGEPTWTADVTTRWPLALLGTSLYALTESSITELDAASGAVRKRMPLPAAPTAGMAWTRDTLVVPLASSSLAAWRITDVQPYWTMHLPAPTHVAPAIAADTVFAALEDSRVAALKLSDGAERWTTTIGGTPREIVAGKDLAVVASSDRFVYALKASSGKLAFPRRSALDVIGVLIDDDHVYVVDLDNTIRAYAHSGHQKWKKVIDTRVTAPPRMTEHGILLVGANSTLMLIGVQGAALGTYSLPELAVVTMPPAVIAGSADNTEHVELFVTTQDGLLGLKRKPLPPDAGTDGKTATDKPLLEEADPKPATATPEQPK
jgi:hypothetical protein